MMTFQRITVNPEICGGKPVIRGLRFPVSRLLYLATEDIHEALSYAALLADEQVIEFAS